MHSKRNRAEPLPKSRRVFIASTAPYIAPPKADAMVPMMGQRKRKPVRRLKLNPIPVKVD